MILKEPHYYPKEVGAGIPLIFVHPARIIAHGNSEHNTGKRGTVASKKQTT
jgi:hypothetical protein